MGARTSTWLTERLSLRLPIIAAPMAGGPTSTDLVAAVCNAGGLGVLAGGYQQPEALSRAIRELRRQTRAPFGVNLLVPPAEAPAVPPAILRSAIDTFAPYAAELDLPWPPDLSGDPGEDFDALLDVVTGADVPFFSFTFGIPGPSALAALRRGGTVTAGTATTTAEAAALAQAGVDVVCVQGSEAGGHRGTFLGDPAGQLTGLGELLPAVRRATTLPVVAAGGIMDGAGIAAVLAAGATAAQLGTAFLLCPEAATSRPYRRAVAAAGNGDTVLTCALSGKPARGIANRLTTELAGVELPPYPVTNELTRGLRRRAAECDDEQFLSLWAGEGVGAARQLPAAALTRILELERQEASQGPAGASASQAAG